MTFHKRGKTHPITNRRDTEQAQQRGSMAKPTLYSYPIRRQTKLDAICTWRRGGRHESSPDQLERLMTNRHTPKRKSVHKLVKIDNPSQFYPLSALVLSVICKHINTSNVQSRSASTEHRPCAPALLQLSTCSLVRVVETSRIQLPDIPLALAEHHLAITSLLFVLPN